ncbi:MAG TPA: prevent-host-death protein [Lactobacillus sp.]|nr:prevent-host-death protein [Lactobacillus sp.]
MKTYTPTKLRKDLYTVVNDVANHNQPVEITLQSKDHAHNNGAVIISKAQYEEYERDKELAFLRDNGVLNVVNDRMDHEKPGDFDPKNAY